MSSGGTRWIVRAGKPLRGNIRVPGDKSVAHRGLMFGALAEGESILRRFPSGLDNRATADAFRAMGVSIDLDGESARIRGVGLSGLRMPLAPLDCGNSGTTIRLIAGLLAGQTFGTRLIGDASLTGRPMRRVVEPLRARGAHIAGSAGKKPDDVYPPIAIAPLVPPERLSAIEVSTGVPSAQVKSAILLSGLYADGPTLVTEPLVSRDHTERMMDALGVPIERVGSTVALDPTEWSRRWDGFDWEIPGDISSAAFPIVAALVVPGSDVTIESVGQNPTRSGVLEALGDMGARIRSSVDGSAAGSEPFGRIRAGSSSLRGTIIAGERVVRSIDEIPILCAAAAVASGTTKIVDAAELRIKETDRLSAMARVLRAFGVTVVEQPDGLAVEGTTALRGAEVESEGDHRIAMTAAVLALVAEGESIVHDVDCVATSFPGFAALLRDLGADVDEVTS